MTNLSASQASAARDKEESTLRKLTAYPLILVIVAIATLVGAGLVAGQNANSSTTSNSNTAAKKPRRSKAAPKTNAAEATTAATEATTPPAKPKPRKRTGRCDPNNQEQTDLSGTYTGKVKHGDQEPMDATLTITGNNVTMQAGSDTHNGRISAVTTCGYTAATVMMDAAAGNPAMIVSLRAKKMGDNLTLTSVPGEPNKVSFTTGAMKGKPRHKRTAKPKTATPSPAATPPQQ